MTDTISTDHDLIPAPVPDWFDIDKVVSPELRAAAGAISRKVWELKWTLVDLLEGAMPIAVELTKARDRAVAAILSTNSHLERRFVCEVEDGVGNFIDQMTGLWALQNAFRDLDQVAGLCESLGYDSKEMPEMLRDMPTWEENQAMFARYADDTKARSDRLAGTVPPAG